MLTVKDKEEADIWDHIDDFLKVYEAMKNKEWSWSRNFQCKYVELRVDMRDGGCIIMDRDGHRINPESLAYQYGNN